jgi:hypothetical protein
MIAHGAPGWVTGPCKLVSVTTAPPAPGVGPTVHWHVHDVVDGVDELHGTLFV